MRTVFELHAGTETDDSCHRLIVTVFNGLVKLLRLRLIAIYVSLT